LDHLDQWSHAGLEELTLPPYMFHNRSHHVLHFLEEGLDFGLMSGLGLVDHGSSSFL
jgi:hypothetical protein